LPWIRLFAVRDSWRFISISGYTMPARHFANYTHLALYKPYFGFEMTTNGDCQPAREGGATG
jgi:hypothetical protein